MGKGRGREAPACREPHQVDTDRVYLRASGGHFFESLVWRGSTDNRQQRARWPPYAPFCSDYVVVALVPRSCWAARSGTFPITLSLARTRKHDAQGVPLQLPASLEGKFHRRLGRVVREIEAPLREGYQRCDVPHNPPLLVCV